MGEEQEEEASWRLSTPTDDAAETSRAGGRVFATALTPLFPSQ